MKLDHFSAHSIIFMYFILSSIFYAQEPPLKWGEIPKADLEMTTFPADTNASAVILCDYGESTFNDDLNIVFKKHLRIKILNQKGYKWGTHSIVIYTNDGTEFIDDIEGVTYSLDDQGNIIKNELDEDDIFKERVSDERTAYKFTLPALKPGCIIEIRYKIFADNIWFMRDWIFQHDEPVKWSEYRIRSPKAFAYAIVTLGYEPYEIKDYEEVTQIFSGSAQAYLNESIVKCNYWRWAVKDAPAIRDEPFITTTDDYINEVEVQLAGYSFPGGVKRILNDWRTLVNELVDHENFGEMIDDTRQVTKLAEKVTARCNTRKEKVEALYNWVSKSIVCTGRDDFFAEQDLDDVIETKKGNNAEITFLFLSLLKSLAIEADPVILSTRNNGKIHDVYPITSQFNYVLARVFVDSQYCLIDPTDPLRPMDLLPFKVQNVKGLIIQEDSLKWVRIGSPKYDHETGLALVKVNSDGSVEGICESLYFDYAALFFRHQMKDKDTLEIGRDVFETEKFGLEIDSANVIGLDSLEIKPKVKIWYSSDNYTQNNGDIIYINPFIMNRMTENPLKSQTRNFPLDFGVRLSSKVIYTLTLPDSFEVKEIIKNKHITTGSGISFNRAVQMQGNQIQILDKFESNETEVNHKHYAAIRRFYSMIVDAYSEQIVLQRKLPTSSENNNTEEKTEVGSK